MKVITNYKNNILFNIVTFSSVITVLVLSILSCCSAIDIGSEAQNGLFCAVPLLFIVLSVKSHYRKKYLESLRVQPIAKDTLEKILDNDDILGVIIQNLDVEDLLLGKVTKSSDQKFWQLLRKLATQYGMQEGGNYKKYFNELQQDTIRLWKVGAIPDRFLRFKLSGCLSSQSIQAMRSGSTSLLVMGVWNNFLDPTIEPITSAEIENLFKKDYRADKGLDSRKQFPGLHFTHFLSKLHSQRRIQVTVPLRGSLTYAAFNNDLVALELLIKLGGEIDHFSDNRHPLMHAVLLCNVQMIHFIMAHSKNNVNFLYSQVGTGYRHTTIHFACKYGNKDVLGILLYYGADVNRGDSQNRTPLDMAELWRYESNMVKLLKKHGATRFPTPLQ